ncbi:HMG-Y-related protein B-like [Tripterygium wilfordii]|uniref:HMG-Y-related protein B-like n=1 Tax=Tripterygium wilfordii TaxID=458696 RepID=A0A7J7DV00_TRIWF|nr:HMG-Y-related protein B-like [Tripterygium wilfordii]KAF5750133.1 HMG-Y-related protein B-like [Tripterygium wilfordii]
MEIQEPTNPQLPFPSPPPPQPQEQQQPSILPQYPELIMAAIEALNDPNGSSKSAISKQIEETYADLPASHSTLLSHHLNKMKQIGQLAMVKNNYMKPDPNAPPKRGRGRPPKPKEPLPPRAELPPARPRGRPPKPKDPFAPAPPAKPKSSSSGTGRPRGRPPKRAKTAASAPASAPSTGAAPRGRGRPPKVKPAVEPVGG